MRRTLCILLAAAVAPATARAHDFWIEPGRARPAPATPLSITAFIGHADEVQAYPRNPDHIRRLELLRLLDGGTFEARALAGLDGRLPTGRSSVCEAGTYVAVYRSHPSALELPAERFEGYLEEVGLERIVAARARLGETQAPGTEAYERCAKALVQVGEAASTLPGPVGGLPLEITALEITALELAPERAVPRPSAASDGGATRWRLRASVACEGAPVEGLLVQAHSLGEAERPVPEVPSALPAGARPSRTLAARTDARGEVELVLERPGPWYLSTVHMERADPGPIGSGASSGSGSAGESSVGESSVAWRSWWASLWFDLSPTDPARAVPDRARGSAH